MKGYIRLSDFIERTAQANLNQEDQELVGLVIETLQNGLDDFKWIDRNTLGVIARASNTELEVDEGCYSLNIKDNKDDACVTLNYLNTMEQLFGGMQQTFGKA